MLNNIPTADEMTAILGQALYPVWQKLCNKINENREVADKLRTAFKAWIDNGHNNFDDENTIILCIKLTDGLLFSHGTRYDIEF